MWCSTSEEEDEEDDLSNNKIVQFCKSLTTFSDTYDGDKFFTMQVRWGLGAGSCVFRRRRCTPESMSLMACWPAVHILGNPRLCIPTAERRARGDAAAAGAAGGGGV